MPYAPQICIAALATFRAAGPVRPLGHADVDRGHPQLAHCLTGQHDVEIAADPADKIAGVRSDRFEVDGTRPGAAEGHDLGRGPRGPAWLRGADDEGAYLLLLGDREHQGDRRLGRVRDEHLLAVKDPAVTVPAGPGGELPGIRSGLRLGESPRGRDLAGDQAGHPASHDVLGRVCEQRLRHLDGCSRIQGGHRAGVGHLLEGDDVRQRRGSGAARFRRERQAKIPIDRSSSHTGFEKACAASISAACGSSRSQARARTVSAIAAHSSSRIISLLASQR
jgi:hypothetical protein